jgi:hypothetical protein
MKMEYANSGGSSPYIRVQIGTGTNGTGTVNGTTTTRSSCVAAGNSGATLFNCLFAGGAAWFSMMMWRDLNSDSGFMMVIERSHDGTGADTSTYVTQFCGPTDADGNHTFTMQHIVFGVGATTQWMTNTGKVPGLLPYFVNNSGASISWAFNGNSPLCPYFPAVGYWDYPGMGAAFACASDFSELATFTQTLFGASHTWLGSKQGGFANGGNRMTCIRWE